MNVLTGTVLEIAAREVGVRELGKNRGIRVEEYQRAAGADPGDPWCASFVVWCFLEACHELNLDMPLPVTPGVLKLWRKSEEWFHWHRPTAGSIFIQDHGGGLGHCGLVVDVANDDHLYTIEGNTGPGPLPPGVDREGDGVYRRHDRRAADPTIVGYIDVSRRAGGL